MTISWGQFTRSDGTSYRQIVVSEESNADLFRTTAECIESSLPGRWTARTDGLDQRYWDYESNGGKITLHLEHYLGISIFPTDGGDADTRSVQLLEEVYRALSGSPAQ